MISTFILKLLQGLKYFIVRFDSIKEQEELLFLLGFGKNKNVTVVKPKRKKAVVIPKSPVRCSPRLHKV